MFANTLNFFNVSNTLQSQVISEKVIFKQEIYVIEMRITNSLFRRQCDIAHDFV